MDSITLYRVGVIYSNFSGLEGRFNEAGERSFSVLLDDSQVADDLTRDGWNVKPLVDEDNEVRAWHLPVKVKFGSRVPPRIFKIRKSHGDYVQIFEDQVDYLDTIRIEYIDITINPYVWSVRGDTGVAAYLNTMYVVPELTELDMKWENWTLEGLTEEDLEEADTVIRRIQQETE